MSTRPYQQLIVWKEAHALCLSIYSKTSAFPDSEKFGLISQMRRAAYSVPTNIVEGNARSSAKEHKHFLSIAKASLEELHYQCILSKDLLYMDELSFCSFDKHIGRVGFLLRQFTSSLR